MTRKPLRQRIRAALIIASLLLFPVTLNWFSPYLIIQGASERVINGSFLMFTAFFFASLFLGRGWCGWLCPGAGLQEALFRANNKPARGGKADWVKWGIWIPWIGIIAMVAVGVGGYIVIDPLYMMENGISVVDPMNYVIYYSVLTLIVVLALSTGRRGFCHYSCWMSPFMIIGRKISNVLRLPALRLRTETDKCTDCGRCTVECPMSLDVAKLAKSGSMEHAECVLCGTCADVCPRNVIRYTFGRPQKL